MLLLLLRLIEWHPTQQKYIELKWTMMCSMILRSRILRTPMSMCVCLRLWTTVMTSQVTSIWAHHLTQKNKPEILDTKNRNSFTTTSTFLQIRTSHTVYAYIRACVRVCKHCAYAASKKFTYKIFMYFVCVLDRKRHILAGLLLLLLLHCVIKYFPHKFEIKVIMYVTHTHIHRMLKNLNTFVHKA